MRAQIHKSGNLFFKSFNHKPTKISNIRYEVYCEVVCVKYE